MNSLRWMNQLPGYVIAGIIIIAIVWLVLLYKRIAGQYTPKTACLLLIPKILIFIMLLIAFYDPVISTVTIPEDANRLLFVTDTSSSMFVKDAREDRYSRAVKIADELRVKLEDFGIPTKAIHFQFDNELYDNTKRKLDNKIRPTDLGVTMASLSQNPQTADLLGLIMLTDGGDQAMANTALPSCPMQIVGVGTNPNLWNDLAITDVQCPTSAEQSSSFEIVADLRAFTGGLGSKTDAESFKDKLNEIKATLKLKENDGYKTIATQKVDLSQSRKRITFEIKAPKEPTTLRYKIELEEIESECSFLNNSRDFNVQIEKRNLNILMFTHSLGWDFNTLRRTLDADPAIALTAMYRTFSSNASGTANFTVQGQRQKGDELLSSGFPDGIDTLNMYQCIILGSFEASNFTVEQIEALLQYVKDGGAVIFLGGPESFGCGGYASTGLSNIIPWQIANNEQSLRRGFFTVSKPATTSQQSFGLELLADSKLQIESINVPGPLKPSAISLLDVHLTATAQSIIALQQYGKGQVLAIASNTLWKWTRSPVGDLSLAETTKMYNSFYTQSIRNLTDSADHQRFISIDWDQEHYNPGTTAIAEITVAGKFTNSPIRFDAKLTELNVRSNEGVVKTIDVQPLAGTRNMHQLQIPFDTKGLFSFELQAYSADNQPIESYEHLFEIGPQFNEGANLAVDEAFLSELAVQTGGQYYNEGQLELLAAYIKNKVVGKARRVEKSIIQNNYVYLIIFIALLMLEWVIRRRVNLI
ncbi:MAG: hypothetical protein JEZ07_04960 [Phycisphaerae bacterium]|nr:hypothetical protein [Phycisphaerae bacterium]